jgi:uncharacterized membrane protein
MAQRRAMIAAAVRAPPRAPRIAAVDALRGIAICAMIAYHFCFDLRYFGVTHADFERDPFWLGARAIILSSFLLLAGASLVLADRRGGGSRAFWRHVGVIAACALLVSVASYAMFPRSYIWFGVLHAIALSLVLARPLVRHPGAALLVGTGIVVAGNLVAHPAFDHRALGWLGFMTAKPRTEDYVPLFPWAGLTFIGIALGHALARRDFTPRAALARAPRGLARLGRHSLPVDKLHQPLLFSAQRRMLGR